MRKIIRHKDWSMAKGPYENHYYELGETIRETVAAAQESLAELGLHGPYSSRELRSAGMGCIPPGTEILPVKWVVSQDMAPPQSLGELCLEVASECNNGPAGIHRNVLSWRKWAKLLEKDGLNCTAQDMRDLRRAMWHKSNRTDKND